MKTPLLFVVIGLVAANGFAQAPSTVTPAAAPDAAVGISSRDGITISGSDVLVTRNGLTEKLREEITLPNGMRVLPNGSIITRNGGTATLRPTQILTFDGRFMDAPVRETASPTTTTTTTTTTNTGAPAVVPAPQVTKKADEEAAQVESERRAAALQKGNIKAGEGVQK